MTSHPTEASTVAGYRLVRKLGIGSRADVFLGSGETGSVVLKVFHPDVAVENIGAELDALTRLDSLHLVRLVDVASTADETPIPILERVHRGSIAALLRDRDSLEAGEVVTLLAPLAGALTGLHRAGVAHGRIGTSTVHLGSGGEPVLLGFGHCELFARDGSIAAIDAEPAAQTDRHALASLAVTLLSRVRDAATENRVVRLIEWIDSAPREYEFVERLEARMFDFADPIAVELRNGMDAAPGSEVGFAVPSRIASPQSAGLAHGSAPKAAPPQTETAPVGTLVRLEALLSDNPVEVIRGRALSFVKGVRKPFWVVAAGVGVALVLALSLIPSSGKPAAAATIPTATATPTTIPSSAQPLPADPVQALPLLLAARSACIRSLSVLCLDGVDDASSSAYAADAALLEQLQGGTEIPKAAIITTLTPSLVETLGNSALVNLGPNSNPALVLMIRTGAGWRIRGYLSGMASTGSPTPSG
jgi:serine/threonine protein kinase